eukprot:CAMPEP_0184699358 /NCGR_PEP_ID=MMETSP0313-20130426/5657_1 /TAXON_ID=2792 /ORGANISM="Porphyridium aerugineum, Strain SAG 1380-2" /LENGTH=365 /DNA_ID=CAMNT_0027158433 /DNA_START=105 /DNA_END=1199 /DNA_ORIENTATION=+
MIRLDRGVALGHTLVMVVVLILMSLAPISAQSSAMRFLTTAARGKNGISEISTDRFRQFMENDRRDFDAIVFFTAGESCQPCMQVLQELRPLVARLHEARENGKSPKAKRTFFVLVTLSRSDESLIAAYRPQYFPYLWYAPGNIPLPGMGVPESLSYNLNLGIEGLPVWFAEQVDYSIGKRNLFGPRFWGVSTHPGFHEVFYKSQPFLFLGLLVFTPAMLYYGWHRSSMFWYGVLLLLYVVSLSGMFYVILRGAPMATFKDEQWVLFSGGGYRSQYGLEGWIMTSCYASIGLMLILAVEGPPTWIVKHIPNKVVNAFTSMLGSSGVGYEQVQAETRTSESGGNSGLAFWKDRGAVASRVFSTLFS